MDALLMMFGPVWAIGGILLFLAWQPTSRWPSGYRRWLARVSLLTPLLAPALIVGHGIGLAPAIYVVAMPSVVMWPIAIPSLIITWTLLSAVACSAVFISHRFRR